MLGKRQREKESDQDSYGSKRRKSKRNEDKQKAFSPIKHNFRPPKEPGYYKALSGGYGHPRDNNDSDELPKKQKSPRKQQLKQKHKKLTLGLLSSSQRKE